MNDLPILYNLNFGHTEPKFIVPYGAMAEINCDLGTFSIVAVSSTDVYFNDRVVHFLNDKTNHIGF